MEDVPAGHVEVGLDVLGDLRLEAGVAVGVGDQTVHQRLGEVGVDRGHGAAYGLLLGSGRVGGEEVRGHVQPEVRQRLRTGAGERPQDRGVGQGVAVELARGRGGDRAGGRLGVRGAERGVLLTDVQGAGEGQRRVLAAAQPRQSGQQEVDLELGALRFLGRWGLAQQTVEDPRGDVGQHHPCLEGVLAVGVLPAHDGSLARLDRGHGGAGRQRRSGVRDRSRERVGDRTHPADRHPPLASAVADQVVEEAAVLDQGRVVQVGEGADQAVGGDHAADQVVGEALLDHRAERLLDDRAPQAVIDLRAQGRRVGERLDEGRLDHFGDCRDVGVEALPRLELVIAARESVKGRTRTLPEIGADIEPGRATVADRGGVGRGRPRAQVDVEPEVAHDRGR